MNVLIVGAGAVGLLYGGWAIAGGARVSFLARERQVEMLRESGLTLRGNLGKFSSGDFLISDRLEELPRADVVIITVKMFDLEASALSVKSHLKDGGIVLGLQNGVTAFDTLTGIFPPEDVYVGSAYNAAMVKATNEVEYSGARNFVTFGNLQRITNELVTELAEIWRAAGIEVQLADDINSVLWTKFLAFSNNAAMTCLSRQSSGYVYSDPDLLAISRQAIEETVAVANAEGVQLADDAVEETIQLLQSFPYDVVASMRRDLDAGRRLELESVSGLIARLGRKHGIPTPVHSIAYACLKPFINGKSTDHAGG